MEPLSQNAVETDQSPSQSSSSGAEIPASLQAIAAQAGALANIVKISDIQDDQGPQVLRDLDHKDWTLLAEIQLPDIPIWFEHQVRSVSPIIDQF
jgi:hypothetical protein